MLCGYGSVSEEGVRACPETWRILQKIPGLKAAMFSIFEPGKHLKAHRGPYNGVLRLHLGLKVPPERDKIAIRVLDRICHWDEGKVLLFDDAYEHEAWNHSGETRVGYLRSRIQKAASMRWHAMSPIAPVPKSQ